MFSWTQPPSCSFSSAPLQWSDRISSTKQLRPGMGAFAQIFSTVSSSAWWGVLQCALILTTDMAVTTEYSTWGPGYRVQFPLSCRCDCIYPRFSGYIESVYHALSRQWWGRKSLSIYLVLHHAIAEPQLSTAHWDPHVLCTSRAAHIVSAHYSSASPGNAVFAATFAHQPALCFLVYEWCVQKLAAMLVHFREDNAVLFPATYRNPNFWQTREMNSGQFPNNQVQDERDGFTIHIACE